MNSNHFERSKANEERAESLHQQRLAKLKGAQNRLARRREQESALLVEAILREERSEQVRLKVRKLCEPFLDPQRHGGLPLNEVLEGALSWVAGSLACQELDEPAGLKVRRLGRRMAEEAILF